MSTYTLSFSLYRDNSDSLNKRLCWPSRPIEEGCRVEGENTRSYSNGPLYISVSLTCQVCQCLSLSFFFFYLRKGVGVTLSFSISQGFYITLYYIYLFYGCVSCFFGLLLNVCDLFLFVAFNIPMTVGSFNFFNDRMIN